MKDMKDFFISYTSADKNWAEWVAWQLEENGYSVVIQAWDFRPGGNFVLDMQNAAADCERTLAILSPEFLNSGYTQAEWAAAFAHDPTGEESILVPVRVRECDVEGLLRTIVYIDLVGLHEQAAIDALLLGIRRERVKPSRPPGFPGTPEKRDFPTLPPFPSTSKSDELLVYEDTETWVEHLPHPLAAPYADFIAAEDDPDLFVALDSLLVSTVKYLAAVALSQFWQDSPDREQLRTLLGGISAAHLLTSLNTLNKIGDHYQNAAQKPYIYPTLFERYLAPVDAGSPISKADIALGRISSKRQTKSETVTPRVFLHRLLEFRQTHWEVNPSQMETEVKEKLFLPLRAALLQLLSLFTPFFRYRLHYIERVDPADGDWLYTLVAFPGAAGKPIVVPDPFRETGGEEPSYKDKNLYLCSPQDQPLLNLHPILISHLYEIFFLEYVDVGEEAKILYRHCSSHKRYEPPKYYRFLSTRLTEKAVEEEPDEDLVDQLIQARTELEQEESTQRVDEMPLSVLLTYLSEDGQKALEIGLGEALRIGHFWLGVEFLLMGLSKQQGCFLPEFLAKIEVNPGSLRGVIRGLTGVRDDDWRKQRDVQALGAQAFVDLQEIEPEKLAASYGTDDSPSAAVTPRVMMVLRKALRHAENDKVGHVHLLRAVLQYPQCLAVNLLLGIVAEAGVEPKEFFLRVEQRVRNGRQADQPLDGDEHPPDYLGPMVQPRAHHPRGGQKGTILDQAGRDLTALAKVGELGAAIGDNAHKAMVQMGQILQQTQGNNPILLGDPGVGKTAIVEGFAWRLAVGDQHEQPVIDALANRRIVDLPPAALLAGTKYRGDLEERMQALLAEVKANAGQTIVFIDEIHTILGGKAEGGLGTISDILKPALARGEFPCIGATTVGEYRRYIEADTALARRFTPVWIEEPSIDEAIEIATLVAKQHLEPSHGVLYTKAVIEEAVNLTIRYLFDEFLPGKAIKLLDQAGPRVILGGSLRGASEVDMTQPVGGTVTVETIRQIVSERTGIPLMRLSEDEGQRLLKLEDTLSERIKGQDEAIRQVVQVVKRSRVGLADPRRPLGVFLFAGATGVGKTELALTLAEALFGEESAVMRLDMSEFMEKHQVSRLIGSPPGYVGYEEEGQLTGHIRRRPYSVVLLDEVEKAHIDVQHMFLQLFDAGRLTDARGNLADGRNAIFIMTTNLGAKKAMGFVEQRENYREQLLAAITEHFTPEFLNRINRIVFFEPLTTDVLLMIFDRLFAPIAERFIEQGISLEVHPEFKRYLCNKYTDATRGARLLERAIEDEIVAPLTDKILAGEIKPDAKVTVGEGTEMDMRDIPSDEKLPAPDDNLPASQIPGRGDLGTDAREARNREILVPLMQELSAQLYDQDIEITLTDGALELLCSPFWEDQRKNLDTSDAFDQLVEQPLLQKVDAEEFQSGDQIEVDRGFDLTIEFKKMDELQQ